LAPIEALGIENWQALEKKLVRRLDLTLMPCLWVSILPISNSWANDKALIVCCAGSLHFQLSRSCLHCVSPGRI
jgi:hypothetical protein